MQATIEIEPRIPTLSEKTLRTSVGSRKEASFSHVTLSKEPMLAESYISPYLPAVMPTQPLEEALNIMDTLSAMHLPVVERGKVLGILSRQRVLIEQSPYTAVRTVMETLPGLQLLSSQHIFDAVNLMLEYDVSCIPVLNMQEEYIGCIGKDDLMRCMGEIAAASEPGDILVLEVERNNFSLTEIASILEGHNARVINMFLTHVPYSYSLYVNLKVESTEISPIVLSFERHGYTIAYVFSDKTYAAETFNNFNALMSFLEL